MRHFINSVKNRDFFDMGNDIVRFKDFLKKIIKFIRKQ